VCTFNNIYRRNAKGGGRRGGGAAINSYCRYIDNVSKMLNRGKKNYSGNLFRCHLRQASTVCLVSEDKATLYPYRKQKQNQKQNDDGEDTV
jgi:hypothetical protein